MPEVQIPRPRAAKAWGNFANTSNTSDNTRTITGGLAVGRTLALDFDNGYANGSSSQGISYRNSSGNNVFEFYYDASTGKYRYSDSSGTTTTTQGFSGDGLHTEFTQTSATGYTFTISGTGITSQTFTGSLINATGGTSIDRFRTFAFNSSGSDTNSDFNAFFNSPILVLPTWNGQSVGSGGGNFTTGTAWAAHSPVNGGSIAFDGTGSTVNNDSTTSVYNIAFNATGTLGNTNNTTNAGAYTLTGNALTINGGIDNNSTNLQTINNNLTLGASQTFNATNGALTMNGSVALGGKYLTVNATNATALNGAISGNGDIVKTGSGTLTLAGNNTFTGTGVSGQTYGQVFVTNGTVRAATNSALGTQVGGVSVDLGDSNPGQTGVTHYSNDVSLLANSGVTIANQIYVDTNTGGSTRTIGSDGTTGPVTFSGNMLLTGNATLTAAVGGNVTFSGSLGTGNFTTGGITKQGTGRVTLSGSNGFTGTTTVSAGTLELAKSGGQAIGATSSVTITTGGTLLLSQSNQINDAATITLNGGTFTTAAAVNRSLTNTVLFGGDIVFGAASTYTGTLTPYIPGSYRLGGGGNTLNYQTAIGGGVVGNVSIVGNYVALTGSNTFTGGLQLTSTGGLTVLPGTLSTNFGLSPGGLISNGGTIRWATGATTDITSGLGAITGGITMASGTLTFDTNGNNVTLAGSIGNATGAGSSRNGVSGAFTKAGLGTLTLSAANTFTGATSVSAGTLVLANSDVRSRPFRARWSLTSRSPLASSTSAA